MRRCLAALLVMLTVTVPVPARATFHSISISELGAGFLGEPAVQFVELRLDDAGQTSLTNTRLTSFDKDGVPSELRLSDHDVANGAVGARVLYATAAFQTATGIVPDFVIPAGIVGPSGMLCWGAPGTTTPPEPDSWGLEKPNNYVDCVAYGAYQHETRTASGTPTALGPGDGASSLTRTKNNSVTGSNDTDFALAAPSACNNAGACAALVPLPTPTATPTKAQAKCRRTIRSATTRRAAAGVQARVACETLRLKGKLAGSCPDAKATEKTAAADAKLAKTVGKACAGIGVLDAGFDASCPGYTGACTAAIGATADIAGCLSCAAGRATDDLTAALYAAPADAAQLKCQLAFGKVTTAYFRAASALLARCEDALARGKLAPPCPDAKTALELAAKETKLQSTLCKACGGKDKLCDGTADAAPVTLGLTSCPARAVPEGPVCGAIVIDDLADVVRCAACVASFECRCATALAAHPRSVPSECSPAP